MEQLLHAAETERLNIDYMYAFSEKRGNHAIIILRFSDPAAAIEALLKRSINILAPVELFRTR
jgi:hypothetical protein